MFCSKPFCKLSSNDAFVSCWLCNVVFHAKCVDLAARTADNLREDKGVRWCCVKCKVYDIKFFSFVKNNLAEVENISQDLILITEKFKKYRELIENASCLINLLESPESKRKKVSERVFENKSSNSISMPTPFIDHDPVMKSTIIPSTNNPPTVVVNDTLTVPSNHPFTPGPDVSCQNQNHIQQIPALSNTPSGSNQYYSPMNSPNFTKPTLDPSFTPKPLKVSPPNKTIFAARFAAETTEDDVLYFVKSKLTPDVDIKVFKFTYTEKRSKSSFKIVVPEDVFSAVVNPDFWPPKAIIREYTYREKTRSDIVHLPVHPSSVSKN